MTDEEPAAQGEDLSVPMWVWTLLGFALVTAVVIVVIMWGGARQEEPAETYDVEPALTQPAEMEPAETQPTTAPAELG